MPTWSRRILISGLAVLAVVAGCTSTDHNPSAVAVFAEEFAFQPREIRVQAGRRVTVHLQNNGNVLHDWTVEGMPATVLETQHSERHAGDTDAHRSGVHVAAGPGRRAEITFSPKRPGEYVFYCTVAGHQQVGMEGRLVVE